MEADRNRHEQHITENSRLLEAAVEQASEAVLITTAELDPPGPQIVFVNPAFTRMTGYSAAEAVGQTPRILQGPKTDRAMLDELRAALSRGEPFSGEAINYRKDGSEYHVAWRIAPVRDARGKVSHFVSVQSDVTERKRIDGEIEEARRELERRVEQRTGELVAANALLKDEIGERERAEEALRAGERTLRELVDSLPIAVYVCDSAGAIESFNRRAVELWGRAPNIKDIADSFCGSYKIYTPDGTYLPHAECPMAQALRTGRPVSNEEIVVERPDGSRRTAVVNIILRRDEQGNVTGAINCLTDITEREQAEEALRESEERYRQVVEFSPDPMAIHAEGKILYLNGAALKLFGAADLEEMAGRPILETLHPDYREAFTERMRRLQDGNPSGFVESKLLRLDGRAVDVEASSVSIPYNGGAAILSVARVITERKRAEEALRHSEEKNRAILRAIPDLMFLLNGSGDYLDYYAKDVGELAAPPELFIGRNMREILPAALCEAVADCIQRARSSAEPQIIEYALNIGGEERQYEARIIHSGDDTFLTIVRNITERKRAEVERARLLTRLVTAQEEERRRIARELHDQLGRFPTALLLGLKALSNAGEIPASAGRRIQELMSLSDQLGREIHGLAWDLRPSSLDDLGLHNSLSNYLEEWSERSGVAADFHSNGLLDRRLPPQVETVIYRIAQEALTNVLKHAQARRVTVVLEYRHERVLAIIEDDGRGFDVEEVLKSSGARRRIGLISMQERARLVNGELEIESAPGAGTTLYVRIPVPSESEEEGDDG